MSVELDAAVDDWTHPPIWINAAVCRQLGCAYDNVCHEEDNGEEHAQNHDTEAWAVSY